MGVKNQLKNYINPSFSETEELTGGFWVDGNPIYRKVESIPIPVSDSSYINISSYFPNSKQIVSKQVNLDLTTYDSRKMVGDSLENLGFVSMDYYDNYVGIYTKDNSGSPLNLFNLADEIIVILEYTKTTD